MNSPTKDVLYIDVDDEITAIIDKLTASDGKIVALVLPKRATVLQSIVNMKLLKKSADQAGKHLVLITGEHSLMPLAGAVGLHVAKTPQSKPEIPPAPDEQNGDEIDEISVDSGGDTDAQPGRARTPATVVTPAGKKIVEHHSDASSSRLPAPVVGGSETRKKTKAPKGKDKSLKVPNFGAFRKRLLLVIVGGIAALVFVVYALIALPHATIAITTDSEEVAKTMDVTFDATADEVDVEEMIVPSVVERLERTDTQSAPATGERNDGEIAEGSIVMTARTCPVGEPKSVPAGTGVTLNGLNYITQENAKFDPVRFASGCLESKSNAVKIVAEDPGEKYNVKNGQFSVSGRSDASATGSAEGGTDVITKIISQADIDKATGALQAQNTDVVRAELARRLEDRGLFVIEKSLSVTNQQVSTSAQAGDETESVTVTRKASYALAGVQEADLEKLVTGVISEEIETDRQKVLQTGIDAAVYELQNQRDHAAQILMSMSVKGMIGPELDQDAIKKQVAGMQSAEAETLISSNPGVTAVEVTYGPFWVTSIPKSTDKITITIEK